MFPSISFINLMKFKAIIVSGKVVALMVAQNLRFYYQKANDFWDKRWSKVIKTMKGIDTIGIQRKK